MLLLIAFIACLCGEAGVAGFFIVLHWLFGSKE